MTATGRALDLLRRNPALALAAAAGAGAGFLLYRAGRDGRRDAWIHAEMLEEESVPILVTGQNRVYDPDMPSRHPTQDRIDTRREIDARA
jgi:cold shock CspA family protein